MKVAIYCRLSEEDREKTGNDSESIQNQKSMLVNYAAEKGWQIYGIYCDENYSGIDGERPDYNRLLKDAESHKFDIILCKTQSRFSRNMEHIEKYLNGKLQEWGVRFVSVIDNVDTNQRHNKKSRQINGLINEWYLEDLSDNVKAVLDNKHKEGKSTRPFMPYGLRKNPNDRNQIEIDEDSACVVRKIFSEFLSGHSTANIAKKLNDDGVLSPQEYKKQNGEKLHLPKENKKGEWTQQAVIRILKNPMYAGDLVHNIYSKPSYKSKRIVKNKKEDWYVAENSHPAIISKVDFEEVQRIFANRCRYSIKLECGQCGGKMYTVHKICKGKKYSYIRCKNCGQSVNNSFIKPFLTEKYSGKIDKIVIESKHAARIIFV